MVFYYGDHLMGVDLNGLTLSKGGKLEAYSGATPEKSCLLLHTHGHGLCEDKYFLITELQMVSP